MGWDTLDWLSTNDARSIPCGMSCPYDSVWCCCVLMHWCRQWLALQKQPMTPKYLEFPTLTRQTHILLQTINETLSNTFCLFSIVLTTVFYKWWSKLVGWQQHRCGNVSQLLKRMSQLVTVPWEVYLGAVKSYNDRRGFGFVACALTAVKNQMIAGPLQANCIEQMCMLTLCS